jgi:membrane-associated phospholipid phosphatase
MSLPAPKKFTLWPWLLAGVAAVALAWPLDNRVDAALTAAGGSALYKLAWVCSKLGEGWVTALVGIIFAAVFIAANRPSAAAKIFFVALASELTGLVALILRLLTGRTRPSNHDVAQGFYGVWHDGHWILGKFAFSSFPSGHAATAAGFAAAAWLVHRGWGAVAAVYALAVMWSRIALQCHHLTDVVASVMISIPLVLWLKPFLIPTLEFHCGNLHRKFAK